MKDIKETLELLDSLGMLAVAGKKIAADGKISVDDLTTLISLSAKLDDLVKGFSGLKEVVEEVKDLDESEVVQIIGKIYQITKDINEA